MSSKNKLENKSARRSLRAAVVVADRTPVSAIAQKTSARLLSDPKKKMTGSTRRRLLRSRGFSIDRPSISTFFRAAEVKAMLKLEKLSLFKLFRRLKQACRRAATCRSLLAKLSPGSKFAAGLAAEQTHQISLAGQIKAEISVRNNQTN